MTDTALLGRGAGVLPPSQTPEEAARREASWRGFQRLGLPHKRMDGWRRTDMAGVFAKTRPAPPKRPPPMSDPRAEAERGAMIFADGFLMNPADSLPQEKGLEILPLSSMKDSPPRWLRDALSVQKEGNALLLLNDALSEDGVAIRVKEGAGISQPLHCAFLSCLRASYPSLILVLEKNARLSLIETHGGKAHRAFLNLFRRIFIGAGASLEHLILEEAETEHIHAASTRAHLEGGAVYRAGAIAEGASLARMEWEIVLRSAGAEAHLSALILADGSRHADITARAIHAAPHCKSRLSARSLLGGEAEGVFQALAHIAHGANGSDTEQHSHALLLSPRARMSVQPELAIYADDVRCAHGSAVGAMDENALFYLRQRGIEEKAARKILAEAFLQDGLAALEAGELRDRAVARSLSALDKLIDGSDGSAAP